MVLLEHGEWIEGNGLHHKECEAAGDRWSRQAVVDHERICGPNGGAIAEVHCQSEWTDEVAIAGDHASEEGEVIGVVTEDPEVDLLFNGVGNAGLNAGDGSGDNAASRVSHGCLSSP